MISRSKPIEAHTRAGAIPRVFVSDRLPSIATAARQRPGEPRRSQGQVHRVLPAATLARLFATPAPPASKGETEMPSLFGKAPKLPEKSFDFSEEFDKLISKASSA